MKAKKLSIPQHINGFGRVPEVFLQLAAWGARCEEYDPDCPACASWAKFDKSGKLSRATVGILLELINDKEIAE